ncbi:hypothetical protein BCN12_28255 [Salmonella enterica]|nr:hypothetical protein [Salmonella enterica]
MRETFLFDNLPQHICGNYVIGLTFINFIVFFEKKIISIMKLVFSREQLIYHVNEMGICHVRIFPKRKEGIRHITIIIQSIADVSLEYFT